MTRSAGLLALLGSLVLALGAFSLHLGQDVNFDLLNYHYYVGYAFLHGRTFSDLAPAGSQSFQPPLLHAFHYLGIAHLPPRLFGFLLGALHGLNLPLVAALGLVVLGRSDPRAGPLALLAAALAGAGPAAVSLVGTTFGDNLVSLPALLALVLLLRAADSDAPRLLLAAGVLAGIATGLKLTMAAYHLGLAAAALVLFRHGPRLARQLAALGFGSLLGFLPSAGFWDYELWRRFGNPVFPFANGLFRSPYQSPESFRDARYVARSAYDLLRPFVDTALGRAERFMEIGMRDVRFLLLLLAALAAATAWLAARRRPAAGPGDDGLAPDVAVPAQGRAVPASGIAQGPGRADRERALFAWWATSYVAWALAFYTYRYAALLEFTAPLVLFVLLARLLPARHVLRGAAAAALAILATTRAESWGRRAWQTPWLQLPVPALGLQPDSLILMCGMPSGFAVPSFRDDARAVHLTAVERFQAPSAWNPLVEEAVREHRGPILLLSNFEFSRAECDARAEALGLVPTPRCEGFRNGALRFRLCELKRR